MKSVLTAILTIALVSVLVGAGTFAYYTDTETSSGNTLVAGTMDLKIKDGGLDWTDGISTAEWTLSNMKPGDPPVYGSIDFINTGSISANHLEITCNYTVIEEVPQTVSDTDPNTDGNPDSMAKHMIITSMIYADGTWEYNLLTGNKTDNGNIIETNDDWKVNDVGGDEKITLYDLKHDLSGIGIDNLEPPTSIVTPTLDMRIKFDEDAGNDFQGDTFNLTMIFTLNQDSSQ